MYMYVYIIDKDMATAALVSGDLDRLSEGLGTTWGYWIFTLASELYSKSTYTAPKQS